MGALWWGRLLLTRIPCLVADPMAALADLGLDGEDEVLFSPMNLSWSSGWIDLSLNEFLQPSYVKVALYLVTIKKLVSFLNCPKLK